jgi:branched-chain amino acid aminotransferase
MSDVQTPAYLYFNGEIRPVDAPLFTGADLGVLRGYGIFDFFRVHRGVPLYFDDYLDRFYRSAEILGLTIPTDRPGIARAIGRLLEVNGTTEGRVRLVLTGGASADGMSPGAENFLILLHPPLPTPGEMEGAKVLTCRHQREFPEAKTTNYLTAVQGIPRLRAAGAVEFLYHDGTRLLEGARANVFLVTPDGRLATPGTGILRGITRLRTLALLPVEERDVAVSELAEAKELFLTGSGRLVVPITEIDGGRVGDGKVGPVARKVLSLLQADSVAYVEAALGS